MQRKTFGEKVINFNENLTYTWRLPDGFQVLNPFLDNPETSVVMRQFYGKFYGDNERRRFIIGINPSRHGAGVTGVPFTDTKNLDRYCGIKMQSARTHELSSVFIYDMIEAFGGTEKFYSEFYINSPFPLAITRKGKNGGYLNANYYDDKILFQNLENFMVETLKKHVSFGVNTTEVFALGVKNATFLNKINDREKIFEKITVLEHPRYIQQYKSKEKDYYIDKYLLAFSGLLKDEN